MSEVGSNAACNETPDGETSETPSSPTLGDRDARGRFLPGNAAAWQHGLDGELPRELVVLNEQVSAFLAACLTDEADAGDLPARRRALLDYRARLHRRILMLDAALELRGMTDTNGKLRAAWLQRLEGLINTARALDNQLGLERRAKAAITPLDWIQGRS